MKKKFSKIPFTFVAIIMAIIWLVGCSQEAPSTGGATPETPSDATNEGNNGEAAKYAFVFKNTGNPYGEKMMEGYKEAIEGLGGEVILRAPDQPTAEGQIQIIEQLIQQKVSAIALAANDFDALEPVLKKAKNEGIKIISVDSAVNPDSRILHVNQANPERIGRIQIEAVAEMIDGEGEIAVLSATSQAANQNTWIEWMKEELTDPKYENITLVKVAYGDDLRDKSVSETEALLKSYPDLKAIIAPTTVGIAAAGKVLTDKGLKDQVKLTGLGLPSEMASYIENGVSPWMYLWNPIDVGYGAGHIIHSLVAEDIAGELGEVVNAGHLGSLVIVEDGDGIQVMLGDPYKFDADNIAEWKDVY